MPCDLEKVNKNNLSLPTEFILKINSELSTLTNH